MIEVDNLSFEYPRHRALDDVGFSIASNSVTALVGPNGAGKTTLMRCICGLERPIKGTIVVDGIDVISDPRASHKKLGYLSDFFGLYDELSVRRSLRHAAAANGTVENLDQAVETAAVQLRLSDRLEQNVGELSRGLRQRVAIAQALIHAPKVLILDEPASGLDPEARHDLAELFKTLQNNGMTLLVSSHILAELEAYATDMLVIRGGRIVEQRNLRKTTDSAQRRILIDINGDAAAVAELIKNRPEVQTTESNGEQLVCNLTGGDLAQQALLSFLVNKQVPVINYSWLERDLQQSYLDSVNTDGNE